VLFPVPLSSGSPVEYEYYYEDDYETEVAAPAKSSKPKDPNYDIEDLVPMLQTLLAMGRGEFFLLPQLPFDTEINFLHM
jgi:hypothetical protein